MLKIGKNANIRMIEAKINEKNGLELSFSFAGEETASKAPKSALEMMNESADDTGNESSNKLLLFPVKPFEPGDNTTKRSAEDTMKELTELKNQLSHFLLGYKTQDKIRWDIAKGMVINDANMDEKLTDEETVLRMSLNLFNQFIEQAKDVIGEQSKLMNLFLIRQSKKKHFASLRKRYLKDNPFWEPAEIPEAQSKLRFTDYEIKNGLDSAKPVKADDDAVVDPGEGSPTLSLFNPEATEE